MFPVPLRLSPGTDLRQSLWHYCQDRSIRAAYMLTAVGSLQSAVIRFANQPAGTHLQQPLEILSLAGTLSMAGVHLHIALADSQGRVIGGHLMDGCLVYTTAEIVLGQVPGISFQRQPDPVTGFKELLIEEDESAEP